MQAVNWDEVLKTTMNDEELACDIASAFLEETPEMLRTLLSAIVEKNSAEAKRAAHTIKGSLNMMSAIGVDNARQLEEAASNEDWEACSTLIQQLSPELEAVIADLKVRVEQ